MFIDKKIYILNLIISFLPLSIIIGNMAVNINIILICILGFIIYGNKIWFIDNKIYRYLIYSFFLFLIFTTSLNNIPNLNENKLFFENLLKSLFFLRFLILFLVINKLINEKRFNLKFFIISCAFLSSILAIDIIIQIIFKKDLIGNVITNDKPSGFFGEENIAGNYLQKFSLFLIFYIPLILKNHKKNKNIYFFLVYIFFFFTILLTGNRMSFVIYFSSFILYFLIEKELKKILLIILIAFSIIFLVLKFPFLNRIDTQLINFYKSSINIITKSPHLFIYNKTKSGNLEWSPTGYLVHLNSGVQLWKKNKLFGNGLKSLPLYCEYKNNTTCNTHPHNYFIEIMMDTGLIGLLLIYSFFVLSLRNFFQIYISKINIKQKYIMLPFFLIIFFEFFPLRSTGSFFTTSNAVIIFFILAVFINLNKLKKFYKM